MQNSMFVVPGLAINDFGIQVRNICQQVGFSLKNTKKQKQWSLLIGHPCTKNWIACILVSPTTFDTSQAFHIEYLAVKPEYQQRGMGTQLLKLTLGLQNPHANCVIDCFEDRIRAFQERFGFVIFGQSIFGRASNNDIQTHLICKRGTFLSAKAVPKASDEKHRLVQPASYK